MGRRDKKAHQRSEDVAGGDELGTYEPSLVLLNRDALALVSLALFTVGSAQTVSEITKLFGRWKGLVHHNPPFRIYHYYNIITHNIRNVKQNPHDKSYHGISNKGVMGNESKRKARSVDRALTRGLSRFLV